MNNFSTISVFFLSGLNETSQNQKSALFFVSLMCYCITLLVNVSLILIIILDNAFHEPMYILLCAFCINALFGTAGFYPKFLWDLLSPVHVISYSGCLFQAQVLYSFACSDLSILALMAYDRYLAICCPLEYHSVMSVQRVIKLACFLWLTSFFIVAVNIFLTSRLKLCRPYINRLFCVNWSIVSLTCFPNETSMNSIVANITIIIYIVHGFFIVWSYMYIVKRCANSIENRAKFTQTCVPHLISLSTFIVTMMIDIINNRLSSKGLTETLQNFIAMEFVVIPPLMNPLIYGFKLTKVRSRIIDFVAFKFK
ncbi:olfactory receptor 1D2-like [Girardinichthys multiradiatus]|uniref:olfactory receptor 1D2-like n=1 Tax=Girardinichthys multiradiatus TaxID=208333 RepID=UPI001FABF4D0|nr:olfactory receptor 1D2-like [Girardinichthys multiradiatus]